jgi:hypothetical protein
MVDTNQSNGEVPFKYRVVAPVDAQPEADQNVTPDFKYNVTSEAPPTLMETGKDVVKSLGAGALRGAAGLVDLPGDLTQLASVGSKYLTGYETPKFDTSFREGMAELSGGFSERKPETTLGRYAGTVGEFVPAVIGAGLTGGGSLGAQALRAGTNVVKQAVLPGVASEALGQFAEDSTSPYMEPAARIAGAMLGGIGANKIENTLRGAISPGGGAIASDLANAARLRELGVPVSAGQATKGAGILGAEADTAAGQAIFGAAPDSAQAQAFTTAAMRHLGSNAKLATPEAMSAARQSIIKKMNMAVYGVVVQPTAKIASDVADAAQYFKRMAPKGEVGTAFKEIIKLMSSRNPIKAEELVSWRSSLGDLLSSGNAGVRGTAFKLRGVIDDAIEAELNAMGQPNRFAQWKTSRDQYRNYLAMQNALKVAQETGANGIVTPRQLMAALAGQDKAGIVTGTRGAIGELAALGMKAIKPLGAGSKQGFVGSATKAAGPLAAALGAGWGAFQGTQFMGLSPLMSMLSAGAAAAAPIASSVKQGVRSYAMNPMVQKYLQNQLVNSTSGVGSIGSALNAGKLSLPSALEDRQGRKSGGAVKSHDMAADQLVRAAERAKKGWSAETEPLLNQSDDAVAHALEVANRSI